MGFIQLRILDIIDILLVAFLLYQVYKLVRGTGAISIFIGVSLVYLIWKTVQALHMELLSEILGQFIGVGVLALIIVFQPEMRKFLLLIGTTNFARRWHFMRRFRMFKSASRYATTLQTVLAACQNMSHSRTGALIVLERENSLNFVTETGLQLFADLSQPLIESVFFKNNPLHDGAMVIQQAKIIAVGCILPISRNQNIFPGYGLRHRAAIGISERSDALCLVVSEETGKISYIRAGKLFQKQALEDLTDLILEDWR